MDHTVPVNKKHLTGTVPANKEHLTGTIPVNNTLLTGTFLFVGGIEGQCNIFKTLLKVKLGFRGVLRKPNKQSL